MSIKTVKTVRAAGLVAAVGAATLGFGIAGASDRAGDLTAEVSGPVKTTVRYADLDLSQDADARQLYVRLQRASQQVCGDDSDLRNLRMKRLHDACYQDSLARAVDSVGHAKLSAVYAADERIRIANRSAKTLASS